MSPDYRTDRLSPEGAGNARQAWNDYAKKLNKNAKPVLVPVVQPSVDPAARDWLADLLGFWVLWHLYGGFEGLERYGYHRATIYRKISRFRQTFGVHPDEYEMRGVTVNPKAYWKSAKRKGAGKD
ncbi:MAG: hypothetical protein ACLQRH_01165 [Acidimicrobiales bacterium]